MENQLIAWLAKTGLPPSLHPRIYRGLPRLHWYHERSQTKITNQFNDLSLIKRKVLDRALLYCYSERAPLARVTLFSWIMVDGWGDYTLQLKAAHLLKDTFPHIDLELITLFHRTRSLPHRVSSFPQNFFLYDGATRDSTSLPSEECLRALENTEIVIQLPTVYPHTDMLIQKVKKYEIWGETGLFNCSWYYPHTGARCMGLHFLEKVLIFPKIPPFSWKNFNTLEDKHFVRALLGTLDILSYRQTNRFNLNYTKSLRGNYLYLHTLLKMLEKDTKNIDIAFTHMEFLKEEMETQIKPLLQQFSIARLIIYFDNSICPIDLGSSGKTIRLFYIDNLIHEDFLSLLMLTDDLVGCTGDGSLIEALCGNKLFFYDPPEHKRSFLRDLIAIAKERLGPDSFSAKFLTLCLRNPTLAIEPTQIGWMTEEFIEQELESVSLEDMEKETVTEQLASLLLHPSLKKELSHFSQILQNEHSGNEPFCQLVCRADAHLQNPQLKTLENKLLQEVIEEKRTALSFIEALRNEIS